MKKCVILLALMLLLSGCGSEPTLETIADEQLQSVSAKVQQVLVDLPVNAGVPVMQSEDGAALYLCDGFTVTVQTMEAGDLDKTLRSATGYGRQALELMETADEAGKRYQCVFAAAGEGQTQVGRASIIDDGSFHYVLTVLAPEQTAGAVAEQIQTVLDSFRVAAADLPINTGS